MGSRQECTAPGERVWDAATVRVESKEVAISVRWLSEVIRCWVLGKGFCLFILMVTFVREIAVLSRISRMSFLHI